MKKVLSVLLAVVLLASVVPMSMGASAAEAVVARGYYGQRLKDPVALAFYDAMLAMDFSKDKNVTVSDEKVLAQAEDYAGGDDTLIRNFGAAVDSLRYDRMDLFYVNWDMVSVTVGKMDGDFYVEIGTGRSDSYLRDKDADIPAQVSAYESALNELAASVQAKLPANATHKDIAKEASVQVAKAVEYSFCDDEASLEKKMNLYTGTAYGALVNGKSVCEGYSRLYKAVLDQLGVESEIVSGYYVEGESFEPHMWNYVQDEKGEWYGVDVTACDGHTLNGPSINATNFEKYFWRTSELFFTDHLEDRIISSVQYEMPFPPIRDFWETPTCSGRYDWGFGAYKGPRGAKDALWVTFDGLDHKELLKQRGLYMAFRVGVTNTGSLEWSPWQSVDEFNKPYNGEAIDSYDGKTWFLIGMNKSDQYLDVAVFDIADDVIYSSLTGLKKYSDDAVATHLMEYAIISNPAHDPDYIVPPYIDYGYTTPAHLFQKRQDITKSYHIEIVYDTELREINGGMELDYTVSSYNNRDLNPEMVKKNASFSNARFENRTFDDGKVHGVVSFDFTPSRAYNHNMVWYHFEPQNVVNILTDAAKSDGVPPPPFTLVFSYQDTNVCSKYFGDGRLNINAYAQPMIASDTDLSLEGWTYPDGSKVSAEQRSQLALVVTTPNDSEELEAAATDLLPTASAAVTAKTYEIDLNICGKVVQIPNGSRMKLNLGIPDEFAELVGKSNISFKLYHFKKDPVTGELDYDHPEEIKCVVTPYGLVANVTSFSPYVLVAVDEEQLPAGKREDSKGVSLECNGRGGKVSASIPTAGSLEKGETASYTLTPEAGYEIDYILLNGRTIEHENGVVRLAYDDIEANNVLAVGFVASAVKEAEEAENKEVIPPPSVLETQEEQEEPPYIPSRLNSASREAYIMGYGDGTIHPAGNVTRGEAAAIVYRLLAPEVQASAADCPCPFVDVLPEAWYADEVSALYALDLVHGRTAVQYAPEETMTRAEFTTLVVNLIDEDKTVTITKTFADIQEHWCKPYVEKAASFGWINGKGADKFDPEGKITRAEVIAIMNRILQRSVKSVEELPEDMKTWKDNMNPEEWYYLDIQAATNSIGSP